MYPTVPSGEYLGYITRTTQSLSTATTFGAAGDVFASPLSFVADGISDYLVELSGAALRNQTNAVNATELHLNLDGSDSGTLCYSFQSGAASNNGGGLYVRKVLVAPAAGLHTVNARVVVASGTGVIDAGTGAAGAYVPALLTLVKMVVVK